MTIRSATAIGFCAILLWSLLALFTAASGTVPPFQLAAMTFSSAGSFGAANFLVRPERLRAAAAAGRLGARGRRPVRLPRPLFRGSAPRAAGRGRAHQLSLAAPHRAVLRAAAGRAPARAHVVGALLGLRRRRAADRRARRHRRARRRYCARLRLRASPAPSSGRSIRCCRAASARCRPMRSPASASPPRRSPSSAIWRSRRRCGPRTRRNGSPSWRSGSARRARVLRLGHRREARRHPPPGRRLLRGAGSLDLILVLAGYAEARCSLGLACALIVARSRPRAKVRRAAPRADGPASPW